MSIELRDKKIGIMMGGLSSERDISLKSGTAVLKALQSCGLKAIPLDVKDESFLGIKNLLRENSIDVVFVVMHGGFGEGGKLQDILEKLRVPFTGPGARASRLAMDKIVSQKLFKKSKLNIPRYQSLKKGWPFFVSKELKFPLVVKPSDQGSSIGISFVDSKDELCNAVVFAFKYGRSIMLEEFIAGREITVSVLDGKALPIVEIIPKAKFFDFKAKYEKGSTEYVYPAKFDELTTQRVKQDAVVAYNVLGCRHLSRIDMIVAKSGIPYVLEINTIPGMTETSLFPKAAAAAGIKFEELCKRLVEMALTEKIKN